MSAEIQNLLAAADRLHAAAREQQDSDASLVAVLVAGLAISLREGTVDRGDVIAMTMQVASWGRV